MSDLILPFFSVLIPCYNSERYLAETIESVLQQTFTQFEIVLVDDCSSDNTLAIAERYSKSDSRIRTLSTQYRSGGAGGPRNVGLSVCRGEYVALIDSDDLWSADKLKNDALFIQGNDVDILTSGSEIFSKSRNNIVGCAPARDADWKLYFRNCATTSSICFRREAFPLPTFNSGAGVLEDYPFLLSAYVRGKVIRCRPELDTLYRYDSAASIFKWSVLRRLLRHFEAILNLGASGVISTPRTFALIAGTALYVGTKVLIAQVTHFPTRSENDTHHE
jgi:glycosyltransferase involved in cell wall biosynthesis